MEKVCLINGSPRKENSCSQYLIDTMKDLLGHQVETKDFSIVQLQKNKCITEGLKMMIEADHLIFVFPLYVDSIPSHMMEFLCEYEAYSKRLQVCTTSPNVYAIVNNGFIEGSQNKHAVNIIQHFANALGYHWQFGIGVGAGEFMKESQKGIPLKSRMKKDVYDALVKLQEDIIYHKKEVRENILCNPKMPKSLFMIMANHHWIRGAKQYGINKKALYTQPNK